MYAEYAIAEHSDIDYSETNGNKFTRRISYLIFIICTK